ncbi:uncharacterized protein LOC131929025 [Physella acuta]|uniref:uncharacterized protein LOC131929025 n=1 Tax=Physella acuta TaxID=109671 RepID=UPI0027DC8970|nr:uncharacterized protein LOC131929025 [Physella acuta]
MANAVPFVKNWIKLRKVVVFGKSFSPESQQIKQLLSKYRQLTDDNYCYVDIEKRSDVSNVEDYLIMLTGLNNREVPLMFVNSKFIGGYLHIQRLHNTGQLKRLFTKYYLVSDSEDDDKEDEEVRRKEIMVNIQALDETEVVVKIADWVHQGAVNHVDYDPYTVNEHLNSPPSEIEMVFWPSFREKIQESLPYKGNVKEDEGDPEWIYVGGKRIHRTSRVRNPSIANFMMHRSSGVVEDKPQQVDHEDLSPVKSNVEVVERKLSEHSKDTVISAEEDPRIYQE